MASHYCVSVTLPKQESFVLKISHLLCADWSKDVRKRQCCHVDIANRKFSFLEDSGLTFEKLLAIAAAFGPECSTVLSLDLALGIPRPVIDQYCQAFGLADCSFLNWLFTNHRDEKFWEETAEHDEWKSTKPFISIPPGKGSLTAFREAARHDLLRQVDREYGAKSPLIVSGVPGTVGSGTRSLWKELAPMLAAKREFSIWPFDGSASDLIAQGGTIVCENYPAICYSAVLAESLPASQLLVSKTKSKVRAAVIKRIASTEWVRRESMSLPNLEQCIASEDCFDALMTALAQYRLLQGPIDLFDDESADPCAEGAIIGSLAIAPGKRVRL